MYSHVQPLYANKVIIKKEKKIDTSAGAICFNAGLLKLTLPKAKLQDKVSIKKIFLFSHLQQLDDIGMSNLSPRVFSYLFFQKDGMDRV
jgi:hypothetical protein